MVLVRRRRGPALPHLERTGRGRAQADPRGREVAGLNAGGPAESFTDTRGHIELGVANDTFWLETKKGRLYGQGQLEIPAIGSKLVRFLTRITMDRPVSGVGPSEVRISILSSLNPAELGKLLGVGPR